MDSANGSPNGRLPLGRGASRVVTDDELSRYVRRTQKHWGTERGEREFECIVDLLYEKSIGIAYKQVGSNPDAVEIANYALWRAWRDLRAYREEKGTFMCWYSTILRNEVREHLRRKGRTRMPEGRRPTFTSYDESAYGAAAPSEPLDLRMDLAKRVASLPEHLRQVFELKYVDQHTIEEVADILGWSPRWVNERIREIRAEMEPLRG